MDSASEAEGGGPGPTTRANRRRAREQARTTEDRVRALETMMMDMGRRMEEYFARAPPVPAPAPAPAPPAAPGPMPQNHPPAPPVPPPAPPVAPPAPVPVEPPAPQPFGTTIVPYADFLQMRPPTFSGRDDKEDPMEFIEDLEDTFGILGCETTHAALLVKKQLKSAARDWYKTWEQRRINMRPARWTEFKEAFLETFLPLSVREARARAFEELKQGQNMTVAQYEREFTRLSRFAYNLVPDEPSRIRRFVHGLRPYLARAVHYSSTTTFSDVVNEAMRKEAIPWEKKPEGQAQKKGKYTGGFTGQKSTPGKATSAPPTPQEGQQYRQQSNQTIQSGAVSYPGQQQNRPQCPQCGRRYIGPCRATTPVCYQCQQPGHYRNACPQLATGQTTGLTTPTSRPAVRESAASAPTAPQRSGQGRGRNIGGGSAQHPTAQVYALTQEGAEASHQVVTGTLQIEILYLPTDLFAFGATHSFVLSRLLHV